MNVSCARSSLSSLSPQVWFRKNLRTCDWYFLTSWSNACLLCNTTTWVTSDISLSELIISQLVVAVSVDIISAVLFIDDAFMVVVRKELAHTVGYHEQTDAGKKGCLGH